MVSSPKSKIVEIQRTFSLFHIYNNIFYLPYCRGELKKSRIRIKIVNKKLLEKETFETPYMERFFKIRFLSNNPTPLFLDQIEEATVYTYKNVILELQLPGKPLLQLGFPYKETEHISVQHWDSHTHEH